MKKELTGYVSGRFTGRMKPGLWSGWLGRFIPKNFGKQDIYKASPRETAEAALLGAGIGAAIAFLFYNSAAAWVLLAPVSLFFFGERLKRMRTGKKERMEREFLDFLTAFAGSLKAGYSAERAIREGAGQMEILYGREALISTEMRRLCTQMEMNRGPEELLTEFAVRSELEDADMFAEVFRTIARSGGDMISIAGRTAEMIGEKLRTQEDIRTAVRGRQFEQTIMNLMPLAILAYMRAASPALLAGVYGNFPGILLMTAALGLYAMAFALGRRMSRIEV